jgi:putative sterol carrier protein
MEAVPGIGVALAELMRKRGRAEGLDGLSGRLRLQVAGAPVGVLKVEDGEVEIEPDGEASTLLKADSEPTLVSLLSGELQVIVAALQGRARVEGDIGLVIRIFFGLRAASPWRTTGGSSR